MNRTVIVVKSSHTPHLVETETAPTAELLSIYLDVVSQGDCLLHPLQSKLLGLCRQALTRQWSSTVEDGHNLSNFIHLDDMSLLAWMQGFHAFWYVCLAGRDTQPREDLHLKQSALTAT